MIGAPSGTGQDKSQGYDIIEFFHSEPQSDFNP